MQTTINLSHTHIRLPFSFPYINRGVREGGGRQLPYLVVAHFNSALFLSFPPFPRSPRTNSRFTPLFSFLATRIKKEENMSVDSFIISHPPPIPPQSTPHLSPPFSYLGNVSVLLQQPTQLIPDEGHLLIGIRGAHQGQAGQPQQRPSRLEEEATSVVHRRRGGCRQGHAAAQSSWLLPGDGGGGRGAGKDKGLGAGAAGQEASHRDDVASHDDACVCCGRQGGKIV